MKEKVYRIGATIIYSELKLMIVGYDFLQRNNHLVLAYKVVPYPQGFRGSIKLVDAAETELIKDGYKNELSDSTIDMYGRLREVAQNVSADKMRGYLRLFYYGKGDNINE